MKQPKNNNPKKITFAATQRDGEEYRRGRDDTADKL